jgi:hypothetical protein
MYSLSESATQHGTFLTMRIVEVGPGRYTAMEELLSRGGASIFVSADEAPWLSIGLPAGFLTRTKKHGFADNHC